MFRRENTLAMPLTHEYGVMWSDHDPTPDNIDGIFSSSRAARQFARDTIKARPDLEDEEFAIMRRIPGDPRWTDFQGRSLEQAHAQRWTRPAEADRS